MTEQRPIAVLGGGSFGTAVANLLAENGHQVLQWMRDPEQAEAIVANGDADMIALARTALYDPRWPWHAAAALGAHAQAAPQYIFSAPRNAPGLFSKG